MSAAWTRTNAVSVEQRACRAGPEGVSRWRRIIERSSMKSPFRQKQKPAFWAGSLNEWCPDSESNQGHGDFQSPALPTELSGQRGALNPIRFASSTKFLQINADCTIYHHIVAIARILRQKMPSTRRKAALPAEGQEAYSQPQTF